MHSCGQPALLHSPAADGAERGCPAAVRLRVAPPDPQQLRVRLPSSLDPELDSCCEIQGCLGAACSSGCGCSGKAPKKPDKVHGKQHKPHRVKGQSDEA